MSRAGTTSMESAHFLFHYQSLLACRKAAAERHIALSTVCVTHRDTFGSSSTLPNSLLREPVSRDWSLVYLERLARCPGAEDRQGTADLAALGTPEGVASLPAPLHFWAEETERSARWKPLRPGTLAGLADWSPEGTEERRAPCNAV